MSAATRVDDKESRRSGPAGQVSMPTFGLLAASSVLLATRFYFLSELLVVLAALAVLFLVGTGFLIFLVLVQESCRWSVRKFKEAKQATVLSLRGQAAAEMPKFRLPGTTGASPELGSRRAVYVAQVNERGW